MKPPPVPSTVGGVALDETQRSRLARLVACIWRCNPAMGHGAIVEYAERCFLATVRRDAEGFSDLARVRRGGRLIRVV